jgi:hypothetical protein
LKFSGRDYEITFADTSKVDGKIIQYVSEAKNQKPMRTFKF